MDPVLTAGNTTALAAGIAEYESRIECYHLPYGLAGTLVHLGLFWTIIARGRLQREPWKPWKKLPEDADPKNAVVALLRLFGAWLLAIAAFIVGTVKCRHKAGWYYTSFGIGQMVWAFAKVYCNLTLYERDPDGSGWGGFGGGLRAELVQGVLQMMLAGDVFLVAGAIGFLANRGVLGLAGIISASIFFPLNFIWAVVTMFYPDRFDPAEAMRKAQLERDEEARAHGEMPREPVSLSRMQIVFSCIREYLGRAVGFSLLLIVLWTDWLLADAARGWLGAPKGSLVTLICGYVLYGATLLECVL